MVLLLLSLFAFDEPPAPPEDGAKRYECVVTVVVESKELKWSQKWVGDKAPPQLPTDSTPPVVAVVQSKPITTVVDSVATCKIEVLQSADNRGVKLTWDGARPPGVSVSYAGQASPPATPFASPSTDPTKEESEPEPEPRPRVFVPSAFGTRAISYNRAARLGYFPQVTSFAPSFSGVPSTYYQPYYAGPGGFHTVAYSSAATWPGSYNYGSYYNGNNYSFGGFSNHGSSMYCGPGG